MVEGSSITWNEAIECEGGVERTIAGIWGSDVDGSIVKNKAVTSHRTCPLLGGAA